jgi:hypothetical protein
MKVNPLNGASIITTLLFLSCFNLARADDALVNSKLLACPSDKTALGGVNACGKVWKLQSGQAQVDKNGTLHVNLEGLVLNDASTGQANGTPDGVDAVAIALVCGGKVAAQTPPVPLSRNGDAKVDAKVDAPKNCDSPMLLVRERYEGKIGGWLAASTAAATPGTTGTSAPKE